MSFLRGWCKKNLQPFPKSFFFFFFSSKGKKCRITSGVLWSLLPNPPCPPPSLCNFIFMFLCWRTKPGWPRTCISPGQFPQWLWPLNSDPFSLHLFPPPLWSLGSYILKDGCSFQISGYLLGTYCLLKWARYLPSKAVSLSAQNLPLIFFLKCRRK